MLCGLQKQMKGGLWLTKVHVLSGLQLGLVS
jgi:hypothetical protein